MANLKELADQEVQIPETFTQQRLLGVAEETLSKDYNTLKQLRFENNEVLDVYKEREESILFNDTTKEYGKSLYTEQQLKKLAVEYNLRLLPTNLYKSKVPHSIVSDVNKFCEKHKIDINGPDSEKFFILGPEEHFVLTEWEKPVPEPIFNDPMLLFQSEEGYFIPVTFWGKELSFKRLLTSWRKRSLTHRVLTNAAILATLLTLAAVYFFGASVGSFVAGTFIGVMIAVFDMIHIADDTNWRSTKAVWRDTEERRGQRGNIWA